MSSSRAPHQVARAFAGLANGLIVLVALASAVAAGLIVAGAIRGVAELRVPSTEKTATAVPSARASPAAIVPTPTATVVATPSPSVVPSPAITVSAYTFGGHPYAGIEVRPGTTVRAPLEGTVEIRLYQYINSEVRVGSNVPSLPFFAYVTIVSSDRQLTFRPGALGTDIDLLVQDGQRVSVGVPLFRASGSGRSSWATFYDPSVPFQVVASLRALPSGVDLDPLIGYLGD
jgi:biotin carboxyl carrier protein